MIEINLDRQNLTGSIHLIGTVDRNLTPDEAALVLAIRDLHPDLHVHPHLPNDTRLWAALQEVSGGTWAGCIYDTDKIIAALKAGMQVIAQQTELST